MALLELDGVCFGYPSGFRLSDVDWKVSEGSLCALLGPNGCGKSTLVRVASRYLPAASGTIRLLNRPLESFSSRTLARHLAVIPSEHHFEFPFRAEEVVSMGRFPHLGRLDALSARDRDVVRDAMRRTRTTEFADRPISELSSGERQRVLLARALAQEPSLLVLDEPNAHLDIHHQIAVFRLLTELVRKSGTTVVVVLHDLTMAGVFCDRVALLREGRMVLEGPPGKVITTANVREIYGADVQVVRNPAGSPLISYEAEAEPPPS